VYRTRPWHGLCLMSGMDEMLSTILTWFSPLIAWLPLSGRDKRGELTVSGRPETYLFLGAAAAIPSGLLRLTHVSGAASLNYEVAQSFFRSLVFDGVLGTLLPLAALILSVRMTGRPHDGRTGAGRASLVILAYCFIDGLFLTESGSGFGALPEAILRSTPKLALAPVWGYLMTKDFSSGIRIRNIATTAIFGCLLSGSVAFLLGLHLVAAAFIPAFIAFAAAIWLRYGAMEQAVVSPDSNDLPIDLTELPTARPRRQPGHHVYKMMKDGRYHEAQLEAERYLESHTDLLLYSWQALLRWLGGSRAYRVIFLQRYKALGELQRRKFKSHLDDYLGEYGVIVNGWIRTLENIEKN
jgi:hypothetical protein